MAKANMPILSGEARGQVGKSLVYATWRGVRYARRYVVPANPRTEEQTKTRTTFSFLNDFWKKMILPQATWNAAAEGRPVTGRNLFVAENLPSLRGAENLEGMVISPGARGGFPPAFISVGLNGDIYCQIFPGAIPPDWEIIRAIFVCYEDQVPADKFIGYYAEAYASGPTFSVEFAVGSQGFFWVQAYFEYRRPDRKIAYSPSLVSSITL